jgi:hypothetical protein
MNLSLADMNKWVMLVNMNLNLADINKWVMLVNMNLSLEHEPQFVTWTSVCDMNLGL